MEFYVYQLRASDEELPFYIGKTFRDSNRLVEHHYEAKKFKRMKGTKIKSILDRGERIVEEILFEFEDEQLCLDKETELIAFYGRRDIKTGILCNHTDGGEGVIGLVVTEETRQKMSKAKIGNNINVGRKRPDVADKWKKQVSVFNEKGELLYCCESAKHASGLTKIHKATISDCCIGKIKTCKNKRNEVFRFVFGNSIEKIEPIKHRQRDGLGEVEQYSKDGILINTFRNSKEAGKITNVADCSIRNCIHGKAKTAGGYTWKLKLKQEEIKDEK